MLPHRVETGNEVKSKRLRTGRSVVESGSVKSMRLKNQQREMRLYCPGDEDEAAALG